MGANSFMMTFPQFFGRGCSKEAGEKLAAMGCKKVLVMHGKGVEAAGLPAPIVQAIESAGLEVAENNEVESDPSDRIIKKIADFGRAAGVDSVVAIGGGSCMDAAKCVKLLLDNDEPLEVFYDISHSQKTAIPLITIPTTSGSGSEASKGAVVTDTVNGIKRVIIGAGTTPAMALIDPELTLGVPPKVTAACAFDVLAHAIDAITSKMTCRITQAVSYEAIRLMESSYKQAVEHGDDINAREDMQLASNLGGYGIGNAKCSMSHAFAHALGALYHVPHGVCCAIFTPASLEYVSDTCPEQIRAIAELLHTAYDAEDSTREIARKTGEQIRRMYRSVGIDDITAYIPDEEEAIKRLTPVAEKDIMALFSPRPIDGESCEWVIRRTYELARS
ncbi:iron-containing alcohol dehydrogenase [Hornefia butyriciproducens]|uniref:Iron-containing alcohol dehydrogenase n=1 Tax=Hornefia butyriciproducens TaxID=2652293 RepID=A0A6L5Y451_9FIRM|nr:iron-containing alcohol dehydrogenase [Hornefia butyriciproducens]MDY5463636.1 iron-containing alcohol dehydrogenase [Hornefia butyriciproducens]MST51318.1 iron-containing alcohol dehydrogenase [Hornefia butyriciproducens]